MRNVKEKLHYNYINHMSHTIMMIYTVNLVIRKYKLKYIFLGTQYKRGLGVNHVFKG